jgi:hypothetical protein
MMKKFLLITGIIATLLGGNLPAQTITFLQDVEVSGIEVTPTGIVSDGSDNVFVAGFTQRRVLRIDNVVRGNAALSLLFRTDDAETTDPGPVTWETGRGLLSADFQAPNQLVVAGGIGNQSVDGTSLIINTDTGTLIAVQDALIGGSVRGGGAAAFYGNNVIMAFGAGTNYWQFNQTLDGLTGPGFYSGPNMLGVPTAARDLAISADGSVFVSYNDAFLTGGTGGLSMGLHRINDDTTEPLSLTGNTNEFQWFTNTVTNSSTIQGTGILNYGGTEYVFLCNQFEAEIILVDTSNPSNTITLTDAALTQPHDATIVEVGAFQYLVVTQVDTPARVTVFGIDGAPLNPSEGSAAESWQSFE